MLEILFPTYIMVYTRRRFHRRGRRPAYRRTTVGAPLGRAPRWGRMQRRNQNLTRNVFWFKTTGGILVEDAPSSLIHFRAGSQGVATNNGFQNFARSYEQYKVLKIIVKFFPASVGSESVNPNNFHRGNIVTWVDQPPESIANPSNIQQVMGLPSAKIHQPRSFMKRYINRPRGARENRWALIDRQLTPPHDPIIQLDSWGTQIKLFGDNFGSGPLPSGLPPPPYYFYEVLYKVVFRARYVTI